MGRVDDGHAVRLELGGREFSLLVDCRHALVLSRAWGFQDVPDESLGTLLSHGVADVGKSGVLVVLSRTRGGLEVQHNRVGLHLVSGYSHRWSFRIQELSL